MVSRWSFVFVRRFHSLLLYGDFILKFTRTTVSLFVTKIHQLVIIIKLFTMSLKDLVYFKFKQSTIEVLRQGLTELKSNCLVISYIIMPPLFDRPTKRKFISVAIIYPIFEQHNPWGSLFWFWHWKITAKVGKLLHLFRKNVRDLLWSVRAFGSYATIHKTWFLLGVSMYVNIECLFILTFKYQFL